MYSVSDVNMFLLFFYEYARPNWNQLSDVGLSVMKQSFTYLPTYLNWATLQFIWKIINSKFF